MRRADGQHDDAAGDDAAGEDAAGDDAAVGGEGREPGGLTSRRLGVVDLDGVLADVTHRLHHLEPPRRDWDAFFAAAAEDPPLPEGLAVAAELDHRGLEVVYLSGRPERLRATTERWLVSCGAPSGRVVLRPDADRRPARAYKLAALRRLGGAARVAVLVDDDVDVVQAVRSARPRAAEQVLLADWAPRPPGGRRAGLLHRAQEVEGRT